MKKFTLFAMLFASSFSISLAQTTNITKANTLIKSGHNFGLTNPLWNQGSLMTYDIGQVNTNGAAFSFNFVDPGGNGFKGYPSGTVGGFKTGGNYYPGVVSECGLPVKIQDLNHDLRIKWSVSQSNANDVNDKWWASINVIFDATDPQYEPVPEDRDYDLVIELNRYQQEDFLDVSSSGNEVYWYYARNTDQSLKTLDFNYNGTVYSWVVRYKFFNYPVGHANYDKNDKVHVKFSPLFNSNVAPYLDHSLKKFIDTSVEFLQYVPLTSAEQTLANQKVADPNLYIKSLSAGYEVYTGSFTIANDYFYTVLDANAPSNPTNLTATKVGNYIELDWDDNTESDFDSYKVYRSINNGVFALLAENVNTSNYLDTTTSSGNKYTYYVVANDRSYNESSASNTASRSFTKKNGNNRISNSFKYSIFPNPSKDIVYIQGISDEDVKIEIYNILGEKVTNIRVLSNTSIDISGLQDGIYMLSVLTNEGDLFTHKLVKN